MALGAWCDYETVDEYQVRLGGPADPVTSDGPAVPGRCAPDQADLDIFGRQLNFRVEEFATLSDGRRLTLTDDRGWGVSRRGASTDELWAGQSAASIETDLRNVVLPDDAEVTGEQHSWSLLAQGLRRHGVEATEEQLRRLPYEVVLSRRLLARLPDTAR